eukprot:scaffold9147_cov76-Isochrysis_galbana.AAC.1
MHWPPADDGLLIIAWAAMEALVAEGLVVSIGVANFSERRLRLLLDRARDTAGEGLAAGDAAGGGLAAGDTAGGGLAAGDTAGGGVLYPTGMEAERAAAAPAPVQPPPPDTEGPPAVSPAGRLAVPSPAAFPRRLPPAVNQVEAHPGFRNDRLLAFCAENRIHVTAFCPLGGAPPPPHPTPALRPNGQAAAPAAAATRPPGTPRDRGASVAAGTAGSSDAGRGHTHSPDTRQEHSHSEEHGASPDIGGGGGSLLSSPQVLRVAARLGCSPAQALLRWGVWRGCSVIFKSDHPSRVRHNAAALRHAEFSFHTPGGAPAPRRATDSSGATAGQGGGPVPAGAIPCPLWVGSESAGGGAATEPHQTPPPPSQSESRAGSIARDPPGLARGGRAAKGGAEEAALVELSFVAPQARRVWGEAFVTGGRRGARFASLAALWEEEWG